MSTFKVKKNSILLNKNGFRCSCVYFKKQPYFHFRNKDDKLSLNLENMKTLRALFKNKEILKKLERKAHKIANEKKKPPRRKVHKEDEESSSSSDDDNDSSSNEEYEERIDI